MPLQLTEARDRAALVSDVRTEVHLDLTSTEDYLVEAIIAFACARPGASTFLELSGGTEVTLDGRPAPYDGTRIALTDLAAHNEVRVRARMPYVTDGDGMTVTVDPADGERYVCGFTAMDIAQKVLPCFDQPDLKSTFTVAVTAPSHWTVLANGRQAGSTASGDTTRWTFATTPPVATYLFFVAGGPWVSETWTEPYAPAEDGELRFGWHARASQERELRRDAAELRRITSTCFRWYTDAFDAPYPFADYQQVFTPGLNWGAMEFPGCVAFRDEFLVPGTPTALQRERLASVIAHEMAHMWFGDLVTMRWWEDTWLNESFADFMGYHVSAQAAGYDDAWPSVALTRKPTGYRADRRRSTHPVAEDAERVPDPDTAFANFDMITYAKGNALLRQLGTWLGPDFLAGVNRHLTTHAFGNADLAQFLDSLDAATDRDVRGWADAWLRSTGFDTIEVTRTDDGTPVLHRHGTRPHRFTVAAYDDQLVRTQTRVVDLADEPVELSGWAEWTVVPNAEDETFAALRLDERSAEALAAGLSKVAEPLTRATLWWSLLDRVEGRELDLEALALLLRAHLGGERHPVVLEAVLGATLRIARLQATPESLPALLGAVGDVARAALAGGDPLLAPAAQRALAGTTDNEDLLTGWLADDATDQEVRWVAVRRLVELGVVGPLGAEEQRDRTVAGRLAALTARAAVPTAAGKAQAWDLLTSGKLANHEFTAVATGFWGWEQAELCAPYLERAVGDLLALARRSGQAMGQIIGRAVPMLPLPDADRRAYRDRLATALTGDDLPTVLARQWNDALDDIDRAHPSLRTPGDI